jgi:Major Facilitator Superfamily
VNLPIAAAGTVLVLRHCPGDRLPDASDESSAVESFAPGTLRALWWVYARFTASCTVFFAVFFVLPLHLERFHGLTAAAAGAAIFPLVAASALATPIAVRVVSRSGFPRALAWGAGGALLGTVLLSAPGRETPIAAPGGALVALGASHAFNNLGLQAELAEMTPPGQLGRAAGYFQTARFVGAALAAELVAIVLARDATAADLQPLRIVIAVLSLSLLASALRPRPLPHTHPIEQNGVDHARRCL